MDEKAMMIGRAMVVCAVENGYFDGVNLDLIEELADVERDLFIEMFRRLEKHRTDCKRDELTSDEISSMFSFVFARSVEAVANYTNGNKQEFDYMGMFDGKIPFYSDDKLISFVKKSLFPKLMAEGFLNFMTENTEEMDPVLALFEALKWTWRLSQHLAIQELS
jgi:hypothetical protein